MPREIKTIFITVSKDIIRRNILDTDFWQFFVNANVNNKIVLLVDKGREGYYRERFNGTNVVVEGYERQPHQGWRKLLFFLARTGIRSKSNTFHRWHAYKRGRASLAVTLLKSLVSNTFVRCGWYKKLIRLLILKTRSPRTIEKIFETHKPSVVFTPSLIDADFDAPFAVEAKKRRISVVGMVRSWDNLNHHGLLTVVPNHFVFQNKWLKYASRYFQAVEIEKIETTIIGLPHYDRYKNPGAVLKDRTSFFESVGLDPDKRLIFLGGSEYYYSEDSLVRWLNEMIESKQLKQPAQVMFRMHPSSIFKVEDFRLENLPHIVLDTATTQKDGSPIFTDTEKFVNLLYYSDVTINIGSTLSIDASAFDRPAIAIDFDDPAKNLSYWESVKRFNDYFDHQVRLLQTGGVSTPGSLGQLIQSINNYFENPLRDNEGRKKVLEEFAAPFDGKAGERLASTFDSTLNQT